MIEAAWPCLFRLGDIAIFVLFISVLELRVDVRHYNEGLKQRK